MYRTFDDAVHLDARSVRHFVNLSKPPFNGW